jgi:hypothetical protein
MNVSRMAGRKECRHPFKGDIAPDIPVRISRIDSPGRIDRILEKAIDLINE